MANFIVVVVILAIVGAAVAYIIKEKKNGVKCIGCPAGVQCSHNCGGCSHQCSDSGSAHQCSGNCKGHTETNM